MPSSPSLQGSGLKHLLFVALDMLDVLNAAACPTQYPFQFRLSLDQRASADIFTGKKPYTAARRLGATVQLVKIRNAFAR